MTILKDLAKQKTIERENPTALRKELERYQMMVVYYNDNPSRIKENREELKEIQHTLFNLSPLYLLLQFGKETYKELNPSVSILSLNLDELLSQN